MNRQSPHPPHLLQLYLASVISVIAGIVLTLTVGVGQAFRTGPSSLPATTSTPIVVSYLDGLIPSPDSGLANLVESVGDVVGQRIERAVILDQATLSARISSVEKALPKPTSSFILGTPVLFRPCAIAHEGEVCEVPTATPSPIPTAPPCQDEGNVYTVRGNQHVCQKIVATPIVTPATPLASPTTGPGLPTTTAAPTSAPIPLLR